MLNNEIEKQLTRKFDLLNLWPGSWDQDKFIESKKQND
jgi:hypothetical protein